MTNAIQQASTETIPKRVKDDMEKPWASDDYQELLIKYYEEKDPVMKKALAYDVRKLRTK